MSDESGPSIAVYDHLRPVSESYPAGIYRVVGTGETVALLRVTDEHERRRATGELLTIPREALSEFEPATNPDTGFRPLAWIRGLLSGLYWTVRMLFDWFR